MTLDDSQTRRITDAVARAEAGTAGELVVVLRERSDDYAVYRALVAFAISLGVDHGLHVLAPELPLFGLLLAQAVVAPVIYLLLGTGPLLRLVVPAAVREKRAFEGALAAFVEHGVTETRDRSGVLIYLSDAEHRVVILADRGIHDRVDSGEWDREVQTLVDAMKTGDPVGGLLAVIDRIGGLLAEAFPPRPDDTNELPDAPRETR